MWKDICIYYYDNNKENLILNGIWPVIKNIKKRFQINRIYLQRHWKFGPHIKLCLDIDEMQFKEIVFPFVEEQLSNYLLSNPSTKIIDERSYLTKSLKLAELELEYPPFLPMVKDNTIKSRDHSIKLKQLVGEEISEIVEDSLIDLTSASIEVMERSRGDELKRSEILVKLMALNAECFPKGGITYGSLSYRSHVEAYLHLFDPKYNMKEKFEKQNQMLGDKVDSWIKEILDKINEEGLYIGNDSLFRHWSKSMYDLYWNVRNSRGVDELYKREQYYQTDSQELIPGTRSKFHTHFDSTAWLQEFLKGGDFQSYRMILNNYYFLLPLMGINANKKFSLCYLFSESVERLKGISWNKLVGLKL